jgi:hypothetical protein
MWIQPSVPGFLRLLPILFLFFLPMTAVPEENSGHKAKDAAAAAPLIVPNLPYILPDLQTLPPYHLRLVQDNENQRTFLRFSNSIWNAGPGSLEMKGKVDPSSSHITVTQVYLTADGSVKEHRVGELIFHPFHQHWHLEGFSTYELWSLRGDGSLDSLQTTSGKVSYCLRDTTAHRMGIPGLDPPPQKYSACGWLLQGISPGWMDTYLSNLAGQWLDITSLTDGIYVLVSKTDPDNRILESDDNNNTAYAYFQWKDQKILVADKRSILEAGKTGSQKEKRLRNQNSREQD